MREDADVRPTCRCKQGEGRHPRPDVQGERARPAQLEDPRHHRRSSREYGIDAMVHDPLGDPRGGARGVQDRASPRSRSSQGLDALILAVAHKEYISNVDAHLRARPRRRRRDRRQERAARRREAAARHPAVEPVSQRRDDATTRSARIWSTRRGAGSSPASPASSARRCSSGCSISARPSSASTTSSPATSRTSTTSSRSTPTSGCSSGSSRATSAIPRSRSEACKDVDIVLHQAALGSVPRSIKDPIASHQHNVDAFLNVLCGARRTRASAAWCTRRARRSTAITRACRSSRTGSASRCRRTRRPSAPTRSTRRCSTTCYGQQLIGLRYFNVFGRRQDPDGPYAAVIPRWIARAGRRQAVRDLRRRLEQPRLLLRRQHRAGEPARGDRARPDGDRHGLQLRLQRPHGPQGAVRDDPRRPREGHPGARDGRAGVRGAARRRHRALAGRDREDHGARSATRRPTRSPTAWPRRSRGSRSALRKK